MTYEQIKEQAKKFPQLRFTFKEFRKSFNLPLIGSSKIFNQLIKEKIIREVSYIPKNIKVYEISKPIDPYFERMSNLFSIVNGIQNSAFTLIKKGFGKYTIEDIFKDRDNITQSLYCEMAKTLQIKDL